MKFSVAMCVYIKDNPDYFDLAIGSVIDQSQQADEIVIVADGPIMDRHLSVIEKYKNMNAPIVFIQLDKNVGFGNAIQVAVENCSNELIARMDSDDICDRERFKKQIHIFETCNDVDIVGGRSGMFINDDISQIVGSSARPLTDKKIKELAKTRCPMSHVTVMFKKSKVLDAGGYIEWFCQEDYYLWVRMIQNGCIFANLPDVLVYVRTSDEYMKRRAGMKYFKNDVKMQKYLLDSGMISIFRFCYSVGGRFLAEIILPRRMHMALKRILFWDTNKDGKHDAGKIG